MFERPGASQRGEVETRPRSAIRNSMLRCCRPPSPTALVAGGRRRVAARTANCSAVGEKRATSALRA
eukprot:4441296-Alexandrium_andersonii.AAC.1